MHFSATENSFLIFWLKSIQSCKHLGFCFVPDYTKKQCFYKITPPHETFPLYFSGSLIFISNIHVFYDRMTVHPNRSLVNKANRCTEFQFYWYCYSTCFGQPFCPSSGVLSRTSVLAHYKQMWPFAARIRMEIHPTSGNKRSQMHKMYQSRGTAKDSWWWAERLPETCRVVIPIKLEFSASVGFIHKE